ncbi:MAG: prepilin-type N-terminal cleavage/methylation domain-containing protein [Desulfobacterales bacterium]|nr:prepilin-type N-terminal cleavage/methylation domain-containing protein [Desulfobacterales bacterium]
MHNLRNEKGFTIIEAMVTLAVFSFGILALASMQISFINGSKASILRTDATKWATIYAERFMAAPVDDINLAPGIHPLIPVEPGSNFSVTWIVADVDVNTDAVPDMRNVNITVVWRYMGRNSTVVYSFSRELIN